MLTEVLVPAFKNFPYFSQAASRAPWKMVSEFTTWNRWQKKCIKVTLKMPNVLQNKLLRPEYHFYPIDKNLTSK